MKNNAKAGVAAQSVMANAWGRAASSKRRWLTILTVLWALLLAGTCLALVSYSETPSRQSIAPDALELDVFDALGVDQNSGRWVLSMSIHPQCPCTAASIAEVERILADTSVPVDCCFLVFLPQGSDEDWMDTPLIRRLAAIENASVEKDVNGRVSKRLGMFASGATVFCSPDGEPRFTGGVTFARGHEGYNAGRHAILGLLNGDLKGNVTTPVYGCKIAEGRKK